MAAAVIQEPEAPEAPAHITQVEDLLDPIRADIVARRQAGETLAELKTRFAYVDPAVIREVLPPANARERKQREAKAKATETKQGIGGHSGKKQPGAKSEVKQDPEPKPAPAPRYAEGVDGLAARVLAARQVMGRTALAEALEVTGSAVWRAEQGRIHPDEVKLLEDGLAEVEQRIAKGEFVKAATEPKAKQPSKSDLLAQRNQLAHLVSTARESKSVGTIHELLDTALAVLNPTDAPTT